MDYTDILISIRKITRAINLDSKRIQKISGLSIPQLLSLMHLSQCENFQSTQLDLRKFLQLNSSTVTGIVSRLVTKGLIAKLPSKGDKRTTWLCLTASGLKQLDKAPELFQERLTEKLKELPASEVTAIKEGLDKLTDLLSDKDLAEHK